MIEGSKKISFAVLASTFAANSVPFNPILIPPDATACQEWLGVLGTQVATLISPVGTNQLTSPTSVDPYEWVT